MSAPRGDGVVRVEVQLPGTGGGPQPKFKRVLTLGVTLPAPNGTAKALAPLGATNGSICARGNGAIDDTTNMPAQYLYAKVYPGNLPSPPLNPPPMTAFTIPSSSGTWAFLLLPGAACDEVGSKPNTLVVWTDFGGPGYDVQATYFMGQRSNQTDCGPPTSGGTSGGGPGLLAGPCETAPRQWKVVATGFSGPCDLFNDLWLLSTAGGGGASVWDNGNDGAGAPRVELRHDGPGEPWWLTFQFGEVVVEYELPPDDWQPLNANVLPQLTPGGPWDAAPAYVAVVPV